MKKKTILFITAHGYKKRDRSRFEFEYYEKYKIETIAHDLMDYAFTYLKNVEFDRPVRKNIFIYDSFSKWKKDFKSITSDKNLDLRIICTVACINMQTFKIINEINKSNITTVDYVNEDVPIYQTDIQFLNIFRRFFRNIFNYKKLIYQFNKYFFSIIGKFYLKQYNYSICNSIQNFEKLSAIKNRKHLKKEIIKANSIDYSNFIISLDENRPKISKEKYGIFIDTGGPKNISDDLLEGVRHPLTVSKWYPSLSKFFDRVELLNNLIIYIVPHPKSKFIEYPAEFYGRKAVKEWLPEVVKNCELLCTRNSTAISYGVAHKKPIIILSSDELKLKKNKNYMNENSYFASELSAKQININNFNDDEINLENIKIDQQKYENYKKKYLSSLKNNKPNYKIISETLFNKSF